MIYHHRPVGLPAIISRSDHRSPYDMNVTMSRALPPPPPPPPEPMKRTWPLDFTDRIPFKELELSTKTLGSGSFGTVYKGRWRGRHVAVKQFKTREEIDSFLIEVEQLSCIKHQNIVTLYGASALAETAYLIMEYAEGGSLNHLLHKCKQQQYDLRHACSWAMQTARGVAYLHGIRPKPIMHRDLKPANLLLFSRGKILKICDFGTACTVKTQMTNNTGSASYMAPEVFATSSYLESGDVFSWSIIFWEILARRHPYPEQYSNPYQILWRVKQEGARPKKLESCPKIIWSLITRSWNKDPEKRPSMKEVAEEMEFIFSLTEKSPNDTNNVQAKSPHRHMFPIGTHITNQNHQHSHQQVVSYVEMKTNVSLSDSRHQLEAKKQLYIHTKALIHRLEKIQRRAVELEESARCDRRNTWNLVDEFDELKKEAEKKKEELRSKQSFTLNAQCSYQPNA